MPSKEDSRNCLCGLEQSYSNCCGRFIDSNKTPETPEQLMRSRYSAYILKDESYLLNSWHASTRPEFLKLNLDSTQWQKLKIIFTDDKDVCFVAFFTQDALSKEITYALTELSHFIKEENWSYLNGDEVKTIQLTKNMSCPCQSGRKYKRCCGKNI